MSVTVEAGPMQRLDQRMSQPLRQLVRRHETRWSHPLVTSAGMPPAVAERDTVERPGATARSSPRVGERKLGQDGSGPRWRCPLAKRHEADRTARPAAAWPLRPKISGRGASSVRPRRPQTGRHGHRLRRADCRPETWKAGRRSLVVGEIRQGIDASEPASGRLGATPRVGVNSPPRKHHRCWRERQAFGAANLLAAHRIE